MVNNKERYDRQARIDGWQQEKISNANLLLVGSDKLSDFILADLLSIGVGKITRVGNSNFFDFEKINTAVYLEQKGEELSTFQLAEMYVRDVDFVIDATNNDASKSFSLAAAKKLKKKFLSASATNSGFSLCGDIGQDLMAFHAEDFGARQGILNSIVCSALVSDEFRKMLMPLKDDAGIGSFRYSHICEKENLEKRILQVGAGAIGTFSALALAVMGADLTIMDFDVVEESNLNRQFLFYDAVGQNKAEALRDKLRRYSKKISAINEKAEDLCCLDGFDFVFSCVDNDAARYCLNFSSALYGVPLINGGSSINAGHAMAYFPGKTACLSCQDGLKPAVQTNATAGKKPVQRAAGGCFQPSLIIPNQIIAGLMVDCLLKGLYGKYEKSNYSSGFGIFRQEISDKCFVECELSDFGPLLPVKGIVNAKVTGGSE